MKSRFTVNFFLGITGIVTAIILFVTAWFSAFMEEWIGCVICFLLAVLFLSVGLLNLSCVELTDTMVTRKLLGVVLTSIKREELREVGVVGLHVFGNKKRTGTKYIYFSKEKMDDRERFDMCLKWPPRNKIYMTWNMKRYLATQTYWNSRIEEYNAGNIGI